MPRDASINGDGFRMYHWPGGDSELHERYGATEESDLLSVTSIKTLNGEAFQLVNWKITNVVNLAMGVRASQAIGKRGKPLKGKTAWVKDGPFPGEFVTRMVASRGRQEDLDEIRRWTRESAEEPRDVAAVRGSVVHKLIELRVPMDMVDEDLVRSRMALQWKEEKRRVIPDVTEDDVEFVVMGMANYWDMREKVPFVVIAQEPQIFNLTAGYAGSLDVLLWFLGHFAEDGTFVPLDGIDDEAVAFWQREADSNRVTLERVQEVGGSLTVGDWKTSKGVYTSHVVQTVAYLAGEFVASGGVIDERLSDLLVAAMNGMVIHIRPSGWFVGLFNFSEMQPVLRAFMGTVANARFLATHKTPERLWSHTISGSAAGTEGTEDNDGDN